MKVSWSAPTAMPLPSIVLRASECRLHCDIVARRWAGFGLRRKRQLPVRSVGLRVIARWGARAARGSAARTPDATMTLLKWALICLLISVVAGVLGFTGVARGAAQISK